MGSGARVGGGSVRKGVGRLAAGRRRCDKVRKHGFLLTALLEVCTDSHFPFLLSGIVRKKDYDSNREAHSKFFVPCSTHASSTMEG